MRLFSLRLFASLLISVVLCIPATAQLTVVSAASYKSLVAPDSLASIFGTSLANSTATAQLNPQGQLPTVLAGVSVQINGTSASLLYVSPRQINFLVPANTDLGTATVLVQSSLVNIQGVMQVGIVAPALFSKDASGSGSGAILNAVTFTGEPFLVETPQNTGIDKRTRLAVFATGLRYAGNLSESPTQSNVAIAVQARDTSGNSYDVEYAGSAPGFFGLDQVNLILPAAADGAGVISLALAVGGILSNTVTFNVASLPDNQVHLAQMTLTPASIIAGNSVAGTVSLNANARFGGFNASLSNSGLGVTTPLSVTIPQGQESATFTVQTGSVANGNVTVKASAGNSSASAALQIYPVNTPRLTAVSLSAKSVQGGNNLTGTVTLSGPTALGGGTVQLSSDNAFVQLPATVFVGIGTSSATFNVTTTTVTSQQSATITATFASSTASAMLSVNPALSVSLSPVAAVGGASATGTVTLNQASTTNTTVALTSSDPKTATVPASVVVPSGQLSAMFTISTLTVTSSRTIVITATSGAASQSAALTVNPAGLPSLVSLTLNPGAVQGGKSATGNIRLSAAAPTGGLVVQLSADNPFVAQIPSFVTVASGQTTATFTITTSPVTSTQSATITASFAGVSQSGTLTVQ